MRLRMLLLSAVGFLPVGLLAGCEHYHHDRDDYYRAAPAGYYEERRYDRHDWDRDRDWDHRHYDRDWDRHDRYWDNH